MVTNSNSNRYLVHTPSDGNYGLRFVYDAVEANRRLDLNTDSAERISIMQGGSVGIGTTSPDCQLHVKGSGGVTGRLKLENTAADEASIELTSNSATAAKTAYVVEAGAADEGITGSVLGDLVINNRSGGKLLLSADSSHAEAHLIIEEDGDVEIPNTLKIGNWTLEG